MASVIGNNDEEEGNLATGNPLSWRRASKGKETPGERRGSAKVDRRRETRRTLRPVAGCNKPAKPCVEQAAAVGKNDTGGTCSGVATPNLGQPRVDTHGDIGGRAVFEELQERNPRHARLRSSMDEGSKQTGVPSKGRRRKLGECGRGSDPVYEPARRRLSMGKANDPRQTAP